MQNYCIKTDIDRTLYLKKVKKVNTGNDINKLTITKLHDFVKKNHPNYKNYLYEHKKVLTGQAKIETKITKCNYYIPITTLTPPKKHAKHIKISFWAICLGKKFDFAKKSYPCNYKKVTEYLDYCTKTVKSYINSETGEETTTDITKSIRGIKYLKQTGIAAMVDGKPMQLSNTYKLNVNHAIKKRNKLIKLYSDFYARDIQELINQGYSIKHLVLTVPHTKKDGYKGISFFHSKILENWNHFRKKKDFKRYIYGGFTSAEVTKSDNGWHNHLHIMIIQKPNVKDVDVRNYIQNGWKSYTGGIKVTYENLYKKCPYTKKRIYLNSKNTDAVDIVKAFLEMIKYTLDISDPALDGEDIAEYLVQSHYKRMFNRFGKLYGLLCLRFNFNLDDYDPYTGERKYYNQYDEKQKKDFTIYDSTKHILYKYSMTPQQKKELIKDVMSYGNKILKILNNQSDKIKRIKAIVSIKNKRPPPTENRNLRQGLWDIDKIPIYIDCLINKFFDVEL